MLIPITREKFEQLIPVVATGSQYVAIWGNLQDFLRRLLISVLGVITVWLLNVLFGGAAQGLILFIGIIMGLYWLWAPVYWASLKNASYRKWKYSGFWRGRILDIFISDDLVQADETFNKRGELVIVENRERRINLEIGDKTGFRTVVKAPLKKVHKLLAPGQVVECLLMSNQPDLERIKKISDLYIPQQNLWVGEYPCLQRHFFKDMSDRISQKVRPPVSRRAR